MTQCRRTVLALGLLAVLALTAAAPTTALAEANYVYHERTTADPGCGGNYVTTLNPNASQSYALRFKVENQFFTDTARVYYTVNGSTPGGTFGVGNVGTLVVPASYTCTFGGPVVDVLSATIPAQPAGTVVKYIVSAWHSGGGLEIFGNGPGTPCACGPVTSSSAQATVHQYTVPNVVISQIYGGGGNSGAPYTHDFIELHNNGSTAVNLNGWSVQYAAAAGTSWTPTALGNVTIAANGYLLVQEATGGAVGSPLPTPDVSGSINLSATAGKVALVSSTTALSGTCPSGVTIADLVGFGSTASCFETAFAPAGANTASIVRKNCGTTDTGNNSTDFVSIAPPTPRNSASVIVPATITCPANITVNSDPGQCTALVSWSNTLTGSPTPTLLCGYGSTPSFTITVANTITSPFAFPAGVWYVRCDAQHPCAPASCTFSVTVNDAQAPVITLNGAATTNVCEGATYTELGATATDNCDAPAAATVGGDTVNTAVAGSYIVRYNQTDSSGNPAVEVTRTVTVSGVAATIGACPGNITSNTAPGQCSAPVTFATPTGSGSPAPTVTCSPASGSSFIKGTTLVTCTASNACGMASCSFNVTVVDNEPPVFNCGQNETVSCMQGWGFTFPIITDNCDGLISGNGVPISTTTNFTCGYTFIATRIWQVTDSSANTTYCTQVVTYVDFIAPTITSCPADMMVPCLSGLPAPDISLVTAAHTFDPCDLSTPLMQHFSDVTNGVNPIVITRTYRAYDACSNYATCVQTFTIPVDVTGPVITLNGAAATNLCLGDVYAELGATASDACEGSVPVVVSGDSVNTAVPGTYVVRFNASDSHANAATEVTRTVTVGAAPMFTTCPSGTITQTNDLGTCVGTVTWTMAASGSPTPAVQCKVSGGALPVSTEVTSPYAFPKGTTMVTCTATNLCGSTTCSFSVTVNDVEAPVFNCGQNETVSCMQGWGFTYPIITDNCDGLISANGVPISTITNFTCGYTFIATRIWQVTDSSANTTYCTQVVTYVDFIAPSITSCPADMMVPCLSGVPAPNPLLVTAANTFDPCDMSTPLVQHFSDVTNGVNPIVITRTYRAYDACSNYAQCVQTFTIPVDVTGPVITLNGAAATNLCQGDVYSELGATATDACDGSVPVVVSGDTVNTAVAGTYVVRFNASDTHGNPATEVTRTVTVGAAPNFTVCPSGTITTNTDLGVCTGTVTFNTTSTGTPTPNVLCKVTGGALPVNTEVTSPYAFPKGTTMVTCTATNLCGSTTCSFVVAVVDWTPPHFTSCPAVITLPAGLSCTAVVPNFLPSASATDACGAVTFSQSPSAGSTAGLGSNVVTITATDAVGNSTNCLTALLVIDTIPPMITCPASFVAKVGQSTTGGVVNFTPTATDACDASPTVICTPASGSFFAMGATAVQCRANDAAGNSNTCGFTVTVQMAEFTSYSVGTAIPDANINGLASTKYLSTPIGVITDINVTLNISNGWNGDLYAYLVHDTGFSVLLNRVGRTAIETLGYGDPGFNVTIDDQSTNGDIHVYRATLGNPFTPLGGPLTNRWAPDARSANPAFVTTSDLRSEFLSSFNGLNPNGEWTLYIADVEGGDVATLVSWGLEICGLPPVAPVFTNQPQSLTVECSQNAAFSFVAGGTQPRTNQWYFNNVPIPGANGTSLTISNVSAAQGGAYVAVVCNMAGCVTSTPAVLTVVDTIAPVITCAPNKTVECGTAWGFNAPSASDLCEGTNITIAIVSTVTNAMCGGTFTATRIWSATDSSLNSATCSQVVTVIDTTPPAILCAANKTVECGTAWNFNAPTASDICSGTNVTVAVTATVTNATCGNTLIATRTWRATDGCGLTSDCSQVVTVIDTTAPSITCVPGKTVECGMAWTFDAPSASDICDGTNVTVAMSGTVTNATCGNTFIATRTWTATDSCSNSASCSQTVIVVDTTPPVITCASDRTQACSASWTFDAPTASDICSGLAVTISVTSTVTNQLGGANYTTTRTWMATDGCSNSASCSQTITVVDTLAPVITCSTNIIAECAAPAGSIVSFTTTAVDNCDASVTLVCIPASGSLFAPGVTTVTCRANDDNGNTNSCSFSISVVDRTAPVLCVAPPVLSSYGTLDNFAGPEASQPSSNLLLRVLGLDLRGFDTNLVDAWFVHTITNVPLFAAEATLRIKMRAVSGETTNDTITLGFAGSGGTLLPPQWSRRLGQFGADSGLTGSPWTPGLTNEFVLNLGALPNFGGAPTDFMAALRTYGRLDILVQDDTDVDSIVFEVKVCQCEANLLVHAAPGLCGTNVTYPAPAFTDDCDASLTILCVPPSGSLFAVGTTEVACAATDDSGNSNRCSFTITVRDTQAPTIICPAGITVNASGPGCASSVSYTATVSDNCGAATLACLPPSGSSFAVGTNTVLCTAADANGNTNSCSFTVTVRPAADVSVTVAASPNPVVVGHELLYTLTVSNQGPCLATGITLSNLLSPGQMLVRVTNGTGSLGMACPAPAPLAWWRAEGGASDAAGANHGTLNGGVSFVPGEVGQAFRFDGVNDYVSVPDAPALRPASFTLEGWVKIQDPNGVHVVVSKPKGASSADSYSIWVASGVLYAAVSDNAGSGQFLTYPELPTSSLFAFADIVDLQSLANKLKTPAPADLVSQFITNQLSAATRTLLAGYVGGPDVPLQRRIVGDLNNIIESGAIYTPARFAGVTLSAETQYVLGRNPVGPDLVRLNRLLIRDAYPSEIAMNLFPQLNQRYHIAYSFDDVTKVQALYINGGLVDMTVVNKTVTYDGHALLIGADDDNGTPASFFQGDVDELTLYGRALSGTEIESIHRVDGGGKCPTPGAYPIGNLASGTSHTLTLVTVPTNCVTVSATATVATTSTDLNAANNTASASSTVQDISNSQLVLTIVKVSPNSQLLEICWPTICGPYELQATGDLTLPITWTTVAVPVQVIGNKNCTIVQPSASMRYFRLRRP